MKKRLLIPGVVIALAAVVAVVLVVALGSGGGGGGGAATAAAPSTGGRTVSVADIGDAGQVLVDSSGQALYASDQETRKGKASGGEAPSARRSACGGGRDALACRTW